MFKVGDKVIRIYGTSGNMTIDNVGTVKEILDDEWMTLEEYTDKHLMDRFKLVESKEMTKEEKLESLNKIMVDISNEDPTRRIKSLQQDLSSLKDDIDRYRNYINRTWDHYKKTLKDIEMLKDYKPKSFISDLESIISHKYVEDISFNKNNKEMTVITDYIDIFDEDDNKFKGNKYKLSFSFNSMTCFIEGLDSEYNRKSYWTTTDPHPHVNGDTGEACWGSAGSMLTDNMNNYELYASFIVVLNFLQQVNTEDAAGAYIRNWDCIDENGKILENPYEGDYVYCTMCDYEMERENAYYCEDCQEYMCDDHSYYIEYGSKNVCESCYDSSYVTCYHCGDRLHMDDEDRRVHDDENYCSHCFEILFTVCEECKEAKNKGDMSVINDKNYCDECYEENFIACDECGNTKPKEDTFYCNSCNSNLCTDCYDEPIPGMCQDCFEQERVETANV